MRFIVTGAPCLGVLLAVAALFFGCGDDVTIPTSPGNGTAIQDSVAIPDFSLKDFNPNSARYFEDVSPRDYLGQVSAWYFGSAT